MRARRIGSPMGPLDIFAEGSALVGLNFEGENAPAPDADADSDAADARVLDQAERELGEYFAGKRRVFAVKVAPRGTPFQMKVWTLLCEIPFGETRAYVDLAMKLGDKNAVRAVGGANGKNPIAIIVPCHRVIGKDGSMTGFASGVHRKEQLLALEARASGTSVGVHGVAQGRLFG